MHVPAGRFTGRKQSLQGRTFPGVVRAHAAHRVVLRRPHRHPILHRIDAEKIVADLVNLAQIVLDVVLAQERDVQPQVVAKARLHAFAFGDVLFHAARDHVAGRQLFFLRLIVGHEAMAVDVLQQTAVAPGALGEEDAGRKGRGRMKLHRLHVAEGGDPGLQSDGSGMPSEITALVVTR